MNDKAHILYFNLGPIPLWFGFTARPKHFKQEMKRLGISNPPTFTHEGAPATAHYFTHPRNGLMVIVTIDKAQAKKHSRDEVYGLLTHEAVHVYQRAIESMRDNSPSDEFMAYCIQDWSQKLWLAYEDDKRAR